MYQCANALKNQALIDLGSTEYFKTCLKESLRGEGATLGCVIIKGLPLFLFLDIEVLFNACIYSSSSNPNIKLP
jgi:hypothetical protein